MRRKFVTDFGGNIAVSMGLAVIPIVAVAGMSLDYGATVNAQTKVQSILDTTVIAAAKSYQVSQNADDTSDLVQDMVGAQLQGHRESLSCQNPSTQFGDNDRTISLEIHCVQDAQIMGLIGLDEIEFVVSNSAQWSADKLEVAFVFDMSWSMMGELDNLKTAALGALDILSPDTGTP
ncbi:MAG: pilus assembly protein TadG-related protein, partial [Pseudomonadota bacterium]